ncbi:hypothetical protein ACIPF8_03090 [Collimonas sp. NPDC087041]|uniref:hypothetical protein n=1 Tax=Collimonas sp. NPDC087041 TaxID=3363960 RepID=UPI003808EC96
MTQNSKVAVLVFGIIAGPIFLLGLLYPLLPKTPMGWLVCTVCGVFVGLWAVLSAFFIAWLQRQQRFRFLCQSTAVAIALSLGCGIFWLVLDAQSFLAANFSYFSR